MAGWLAASATAIRAEAPATQPAMADPAPATQPAEAAATQPADAPATQPAEAPATQPAESPATQPADAPAAAAASEDAAPAGPVEAAAGARFHTDRATVWLGGTQVLPIRVDAPHDQSRRFTFSIEGGDVLEVVRPPTVLAGYDFGYVRVRGLQAGEAVLKVGDATQRVVVKDDPVHQRAMVEHRPRIVSPAPGAVVWGEILVGVEFFEDPTLAAGEGQAADVSLLLPDGGVAELASEAPAEDAAPMRLLAYRLNADELPPGPVELIAVADRPEGTPLQSAPVVFHVVRPDPDRLTQGEAESLRDAPRPERYGKLEDQKPLNVRKRKGASGGEVVINHGANPPFTIPVKLDEPAWHQLVLRVNGDFAGGGYPTVGVRLNGDGNPRTASRMPTGELHRLPVGTPFRVDAGEHHVIGYFENDFNAPGTDRNLRIDRYELLRLDGPPPLSLDRAGLVLEPNLHGVTLAGGVALRGRLSGLDDHAPTPTVSLLVDGEPVLTQRADAPTFQLDRGHLTPGRNTIALRATFPGGETLESTPQTVELSAFDGGKPVARRTAFYRMDDPAWGDAARQTREDQRRPHVRAFHSNGSQTLRLPEELAGRFEVRIEARGDAFDGPPIARVTLKHGDEETVVGEAQVQGGYASRRVGVVKLPEGAKELTLAFTNDKYDGDAKKDRNLFVEAVMLQERPGKDETPPRAALVYPEAEAAVHAVDAVVVDAADDRGVAWAELLIDGEPTGIRLSAREGRSRMLLPLVLRDVSPGEHRVAVRVADDAGNTTDAEARTVRVLADAPTEPTRYERAVRLLDRFAYGPEPDELVAVLVEGEEDYLRDRLFRRWDDPAAQAAWASAVARYDSDYNGGHVQRRALHHAMVSPNPARTRFVLWANNHFSTWLRKARPERKADEYEAFAAVGPAPFLDLLYTSATSPAMLYYLDQHRSFTRRINENYAREIMELHSLGVSGGYTQADVTRLAHVLTGWMMTDEGNLRGFGRNQSEFRYAAKLNEGAAAEIFGMGFPAAEAPAARYDRVRLAIEMLASHPSTAEHICRKLAEHYVTVPADDELVDDLAQVFLRTGGDLREVLVAMATHPAFTRADLPSRVTQPIDFGLRLCRAADHDNANHLVGYLGRSATQIFDRDTPDGYPEEDAAYTDSNITLQRWRLARDIEWALFRLAPAPLRGAAPEGVDAEVWNQRLIDAVAVGLTGRPLGERSNTAALQVLGDTELTGNNRILLLTGLIAQLPEATLR